MNAEAATVLTASKVGGHTAGAQAPTPPEPEPEAEVKNCLEEIVALVMKRFYEKDLANARRKKKRKEKKEKEKIEKGLSFFRGHLLRLHRQSTALQ